MEAFLQQIRTSSDRNFLLAVKYSDIFEQVQKRLDLLNEIAETPAPATTTSADHAAAPAENSVVAELPQEHVSLPAIRDGPDHARDGHGAYPASLKAICTEEQLRQVLTANEDKFVVVKLGADWCKPCVKVSPHFLEVVRANDQDPASNIVYAACDLTSRGEDAEAVQRACGADMIPFFAVFYAGSLISGLQNSDIDTVKEFIAATVSQHSSASSGFGNMLFDGDF